MTLSKPERHCFSIALPKSHRMETDYDGVGYKLTDAGNGTGCSGEGIMIQTNQSADCAARSRCYQHFRCFSQLKNRNGLVMNDSVISFRVNFH